MIIHVFRDFCQKMFKIVIRFKAIRFCCLGNAVNDCARFCSGNGVNHYPVFLSDTEAADGLLTCLSLYEDNSVYPQDIFILIFSEKALKYSILVVKGEDNIII